MATSVKGYYLVLFSYFFSASSNSRRIASERELIRFSKRKSSILLIKSLLIEIVSMSFLSGVINY
jgi:hypothetical protein